MAILLIEDDIPLGSAIMDGLRDRFQLIWAHTIADGEVALATTSFDCILLDLSLPDGSGLELLSWLRQRRNAIPVIILTARDAIADRLAGFSRGADDYVIKPFDLEELIARCDAILRRAQGRAEPVIVHGALRFHPVARTVLVDDVAVALSGREMAVLEVLLTNVGRVISKGQIEEQLYGWDEAIESNTVEVYISHLRRKLGRDFVRTMRGLGYVVAKPA